MRLQLETLDEVFLPIPKGEILLTGADRVSLPGVTVCLRSTGSEALDELRAAPARHQRFALAVLCDPWRQTTPDAGSGALLAHLRDLAAEETWVLLPQRSTPANCEWTPLLRSLGFAEQPPDARLRRRFAVSLRDYKRSPDWLGAHGWANPEMFDRYRW